MIVRRFPVLSFALVWLAAVFPPAGSLRAAEIRILPVRPSATDPAIKTFDTPHRIYLRPAADADSPDLAPLRGELLLWIPGTVAPAANAARKTDATAKANAKTETAPPAPTAPDAPAATPPPDADAPAEPRGAGREGAAAFCELAARLGYHVISLRYPNDRSASVARFDEDPAEFERFRLALIAGGTSKHLTLPRTESIEHRAEKLLQHLVRTRPDEGWGQFLAADGTLRWEKIAVAGQSQGGGHAALIGIRHRVARVICTGAPKDYNLRLDAPAAWLTQESATPKSRFFTFNHLQDRQAATFPQQLANLRALGLGAFGNFVIVDTAAPPYRGSRMLFTNFPGGTLSSQEAHTAVISGRNADVFGRVWRHLLTAPTE